MTNHDIADHFSLLSRLMEIHGENSFKAKSYSTAAFTIEKLPEQVTVMDDATLFSLRGVGTAIGQKIRELQQTGKLDALDKLLLLTPPGIVELMQIKGLGPKKIAVIWKEMGIESVGELEYACQENRLALLKGFGAKSQDNVLQSILFLRRNQGFYLWADAEAAAERLKQMFFASFPGNRLEPAGSFRRQEVVLRELEWVTDLDAASLTAFITAAGGTVTGMPAEDRITAAMPDMPGLLWHLAAPAAFYRTLFLASGSETFLNAFTGRYTLPEDPDSEESVFAAAGLPYVHPALRETEGILDAASANTLPELIRDTDIRGIIHSHSTWSDGQQSLEEMARAAQARGLEYLVISDHSQAAFYANGLTPERVAAQHREIDALNERLAPFRIFKSIEADILSDGSLDYHERLLGTFDLVIASVHSNLKMTQEKAMDRLLRAIQNPFTTILGHPTGRLLLSREGYPVDHRVLIDACAEHGVVLEINAHPRRLDLDWTWIAYALERGVLLSVNPDAHSIAGFDSLRYGVLAAQKGGLTAARNLSSFGLEAFTRFLEEGRRRI